MDSITIDSYVSPVNERVLNIGGGEGGGSRTYIFLFLFLGIVLLCGLVFLPRMTKKTDSKVEETKEQMKDLSSIGTTLRMGEGGTVLMANKNNAMYDNFEKSEYLLNVQGGDIAIHPGNGLGVESFENNETVNKGLFMIPTKNEVTIQPPTLKGDSSPDNFLKVSRRDVIIGRDSRLCFGDRCLEYQDLANSQVRFPNTEQSSLADTVSQQSSLADTVSQQASTNVVDNHSVQQEEDTGEADSVQEE